MSSLRVVSTHDVRPCEKFAFWQSTLWNLFGNLRSETQADSAFRAQIVFSTVSDVRIAQLTATTHRIVRTPVFVNRGHNDLLKVAVQMKGLSTFEQGGKKVVLGPGEWSVYETDQPYRIIVPADTITLMVVVPRENVTTQRMRLENSMLRKLSGRTGMGKLARQFIVSAFEEIPAIAPGTEWEIAGAISNLLRLAMLEASGDETEVSLPHVWCDRIKAYIRSHLRDPELSIDQIALALNCTKRYVHKVFQHEGTSVSEFILRLRLERCREDLRSPARSADSITDIAYSWGFNNAAHFSKAFRDEFHASPSSVRRETQISIEPPPMEATSKPGVAEQLLRLREARVLH
jgi:AraC-like DNA-binding protein